MAKSSLLPGTFLEQKHVVAKFKRLLPKGVDGRDHDLVQFFSREGGLRTVKLKDIYILK